MDYRIGIDVMTTETACLSSIWQTDGRVEEYLAVHGRPASYRALAPEEGALYDAMIEIDLSAVEPMAALPFHPSLAYSIRELQTDGADILREAELRAQKQFGGKVSLHLTDKLANGRLTVDQGIIAGCSGGMSQSTRPRLCTALPLARISTPSSRSAASACPASYCARAGAAPSTLIVTTGTSAAGKRLHSTVQTPWSMPQLLSAAAPSSRLARSASCTEPAGAYFTRYSASGKPYIS